ncbi:MAG: glycosyltransferase [Holosporaceae bacterium]|jgi:glycosyltransferase involved in cell wall biosynthesis|nr:glycosyltransferase [Holosporaceae bacterium]
MVVKSIKLACFFLILFAFEINAAPKISVIIPVYKVERFLRECLDSVLNQTLTDFEVICVDDASPDRSSEILQEYAAKDKRVRIFHHEKNAGLPTARNTGLDAATGEYIAFCDSDDYMQPDMLKILHKEIRKNNCDLAVCQGYKVREHDKPLFLKNISYATEVHDQSFIQKFREGFFPTAWNKLYKRSAIAEIRFDPELFYAEDTYFNLCVASRVKKYVIVDAKMYGWRQRDDSITKSKSLVSKRIETICMGLEKIHNSSYDLIRASSDQKRTICCHSAALAIAEVMIRYASNILCMARRTNDLYSRGIIDLEHADEIYKKILIAVFTIIGKIEKLVETA